MITTGIFFSHRCCGWSVCVRFVLTRRRWLRRRRLLPVYWCTFEMGFKIYWDDVDGARMASRWTIAFLLSSVRVRNECCLIAVKIVLRVDWNEWRRKEKQRMRLTFQEEFMSILCVLKVEWHYFPAQNWMRLQACTQIRELSQCINHIFRCWDVIREYYW